MRATVSLFQFLIRSAENFEIFQIHFQREALPGHGQGNDHPAAVAELGHDAFDAFEDAASHPHLRSHGDVWMRPEQTSVRQSFANPGDFCRAHFVLIIVAEQVNHAWSADDRNSGLR